MARRGAREAMSKVDTAWLRMERPTNLMMITGVLMFESPLDPDRFKRLLADRFLEFRRFRQKAVDRGSSCWWEYDRDFDLDWHVRLTALPGAAGKRELEALVSELASTPLDHSKPLWQFHVVEKYQAGDGSVGSALISRVHHCYADGIALVQVLLSLTDAQPTPEAREQLAKVWLREDRGSVVERLLEPARAGLQQAVHLGGRAIGTGRTLFNDPQLAAHILEEGGEIARELASALLLPDDPPTRYRGELGVSKRVAWAEPLDLEDVKAIGRGLNCTVNDVLLASACGALRSYLLDHGEDIDGVTIRATVPVNLRPLEHAKKLGNHFGLVFLELPIGEPNPLRRLERVAACMRNLKKGRQAMVVFGALAALGMGPTVLQRPALEMFSRKATTVATNVPGPQMPLYMAGARVKDLMFWVPQTGSIGIGISILSYNGQVQFGLIADAKLIPDPDDVIRRFAPEFEKLVTITMMEDWDCDITAADAEATFRYFTQADEEKPRERTVAARFTKRRMRARQSRETRPDGGFAKQMKRFRQRGA